MARLIDRSFNPAKPLIVRRLFVAAGRHFKIGDEFDWKRLAVDLRRTKLLYEAGKLMHRDDETAQNPLPKAAKAKEKKAETEGVVDKAPEAEIVATIAAEVEADAVKTVEPAAEPEAPAADTDDALLDHMSMRELRKIALAEGAPSKTSRAEQREAIREHRAAKGK